MAPYIVLAGNTVDAALDVARTAVRGPSLDRCPSCLDETGVLVRRHLRSGDFTRRCRLCDRVWQQPRSSRLKLVTRIHVSIIDARYRLADFVSPDPGRHRAH